MAHERAMYRCTGVGGYFKANFKNIMKSYTTLKVALIGVSGYGKTHLELIMAMVRQGKMTLEAVVIINPNEVKSTIELLQQGKTRVYGSTEKMLNSEMGLELVFIPTGISSHCPLTISVLDYGAHVFVEKPIAGTCEEVDLMAKYARKSGREVFIGFQDLYRSDIQLIKKQLIRGEYGKIKEIRCHATWPRPIDYYQRNEWAGCLKSGEHWVYDSPANNAMAHFLNLCLFLGGAEVGRSANIDTIESQLYRANDIESFDTICSKMIASNGIELLFIASHTTKCHSNPEIMIITDRYQINLGPSSNHLLDSRGEKISELPFMSSDVAKKEMMLANVYDIIHGDEAAHCDLSIGRSHTAVIELIHQSSSVVNVDCQNVRKVRMRSPHFSDIDHDYLIVDGFDEQLLLAFQHGGLMMEINSK
jgi:predicted dehydrogenase